MKIHRFYVPRTEQELDKKIWINSESLIHQLSKVLRLRVGEQIVLFDGEHEERLYEIDIIEPRSVHLVMITELNRNLPKKDLYLFFSMLKKDKMDWVLQKCTEIGVRHFVPIISERTEKMGFDVERAVRIVTEASEQCGRGDIPKVREPIQLSTALEEFSGKISLFFAEQSDRNCELLSYDVGGVFVGPEGGWTAEEKELLSRKCEKVSISDFTLRAETACVVASAGLLQ